MNAASKERVPARHCIVFVMIVALGCAIDLLTKHYVFLWRGMPPAGGPEDIWWLWEPFVGIQTATNPGALFGMGAGFRPIFIAASAIAIAWIFYWCFGRPRAGRDLWVIIPLAMISAGILGNLYDRLGLWHPPGSPNVTLYQVRDWILLRYQRHTWPNFNIADSLLVCGVGLLMWRAFRAPPANAKMKMN